MTVVLLQPLVLLLQPPKAAPVVPHAPASRGQLCCRGGLTAPILLPPLARPSLHSTHPHPLLFCNDGSAAELVNPRTPLRVGIHGRVSPGSASSPSQASPSSTAVELSARRGQCGQRPTSIGRVLYVERLTAGSMATTQFFCDLPSKSLCQAYWAANLSRQGELHLAGRENGLSVMRNGLCIFKTHQTGN